MRICRDVISIYIRIPSPYFSNDASAACVRIIRVSFFCVCARVYTYMRSLARCAPTGFPGSLHLAAHLSLSLSFLDKCVRTHVRERASERLLHPYTIRRCRFFLAGFSVRKREESCLEARRSYGRERERSFLETAGIGRMPRFLPRRERWLRHGGFERMLRVGLVGSWKCYWLYGDGGFCDLMGGLVGCYF